MAAVHVGHPFSGVLSVIQIQHGGHRIHTDPVGMVLLCPEQGVGDQEVGHLGSPVIVDQRPPVGMGTLTRIQVLIQAGAVKGGQAMGVPGEMGRDPV